MKRAYFALILTLLTFSATVALADPPPSTGKWKQTFDEEFNAGALNTDVWSVYTGPLNPSDSWKQYFYSSCWPENIEFADGTMQMIVKKQERVSGVPWTTAKIFTSTLPQHYGYFEARIKYGAASGLNNAFWLDSDYGDNVKKHFEIDVNEGHYSNQINVNFHEWSSGVEKLHGETVNVAPNLSQDYHIYGVDWEPESITWYLDGKEIAKKNIASAYGQVKIILSTEVLHWAGPIGENLDGTAMVVSWVHAYSKVD